MQRIKLLRQENGEKQIELAGFLGVSQGVLSNWERGVHVPSKEMLFRIADRYGVSIDYLMGYSDSRVLPTNPARLLLKEYLTERFDTAVSDEAVSIIDELMAYLVKLAGRLNM